ncbi:MAG: quinol:electron acceptor oxidoreductase subunit ActD, partial [Candidatus Angelobacter sp.]
MTSGPIYGLMAEFETPTELVEAAKGAYAAGYRKMDTYTPYPLEEAAEAIGAH